MKTEKPLSRRLFLGGIGNGIVCLSLGTPVSAATGYQYVKRFNTAIGGGGSAGNIQKYQNTLSSQARREIESVTRIMRMGGFTNYSLADVFGFQDRLYYLVQHQDGLNLCMPFIDPMHPTVVTMVEGPSIIGLACAAEEHAREHGHIVTRSLLLPTRRVRASEGSFTQGYTTPDYYRTKDAWVEVNYQPTGKNRGSVHVVATSVDSGSKLLNKSYAVSFNV